MIVDFSTIIKEWASKYKPMLHVDPTPTKKGNQRVFLFENIMTIPQFMGKLPMNQSPCVGFEYLPEGSLKGGKFKAEYTVHFTVCQGTVKPTDKDASNRATQECMKHLIAFVNWIRLQQQNGRKEVQNIDLESTELRIAPYGPFLNGWYDVYLTLDNVETYSMCADETDYTE